MVEKGLVRRVQGAEDVCLNYEPSLPLRKVQPPEPGLGQGFGQSDQRRSSGYYQRILSESLLKTVMEVAQKVEHILKDPENSLVVLSGCGTSGRLAFLIATSFNKALKDLNKQPIYTYTIAGGDKALFTSQEAPEDDPALGMSCLKKVCEGKKQVLFIGISCGLSAPFVAGQLDFCLQHLDVYTPVLIGFNPPTQARSDPIPGCTLTFLQVVQRMQEAASQQKASVISPAVGPEAVSGSSRMKGGSATKILLEVIVHAAHRAAFAHQSITLQSIREHMDVYVKCLDLTYAQSENMAAMINQLEKDYNDIRGFVSGGYGALANKEGPLTSLGSEFCISHEDFLSEILPTLNEEDTVVLIYTEFDDQSEVSTMATRVRAKNCKLHTIAHSMEGGAAVEKVAMGAIHKLMLNAISTGAHVLKGKIYQNYMIDLQVTNSKLYRRATRLLQVVPLALLTLLTGCSLAKLHKFQK
ncbi:hypothetical protein WMY93_022769 [Mugilogobius chulae]|uniref:SIS domain-containing protein n=1 Tax=Mugilogobius chulae TaxID=88201 RepID=A0AAW0NCD5_9GOBI